MFLILPTRSDALLRRWPVCTLALIAMSLAVWAMTLVCEREVQQRSALIAEEAATVLSEHPELSPDARAQKPSALRTGWFAARRWPLRLVDQS